MASAGVQLHGLSRFMGHGSISTTINRYAHLFDGEEAAAATMQDAPRPLGDHQEQGELSDMITKAFQDLLIATAVLVVFGLIGALALGSDFVGETSGVAIATGAAVLFFGMDLVDKALTEESRKTRITGVVKCISGVAGLVGALCVLDDKHGGAYALGGVVGLLLFAAAAWYANSDASSAPTAPPATGP